MKTVIKSRKLGKSVTFSIPGKSYIYVDLNGQAGTLGNQLCDNGRLTGSTLAYDGNSQKEFEAVCWKWWRAYLKRERA